MHSASKPVALVLASIVVYYLFGTIRRFFLHLTSSSAVHHGPPNRRWFFGHQRGTWSSSRRTFSTDIKAIQYVMRNDFIYSKPPGMQNILKMILGEGSGILVAEKTQHRVQRTVMNPAFGPNQIRELTRIFLEKSSELSDVWEARITAGGIGEVNLVNWLSKVTLDIIGLAGFSHHFNALNDRGGQTNELNKAFTSIFHSAGWSSVWLPLRAALPKAIQPLLRAVTMKTSAEVMQRISRELFMESKIYLAATGEKDTGLSARDLLSLLLKSNMSSNTPANERMSDADVVAQVPTFLIVEHETTSLSTTWALLELSLHQDIQSKLREELNSLPTATPGMDELNGLPYLDAFVRVVLRLHAPITTVNRIAAQDDVIPLAQPLTDSDGTVHSEIPIRKGQTIHLSLPSVNTDKSWWGTDTSEFRPDRWLKVPDSVQAIPGVWSNPMTFWGGARGCIGWCFSLIEMKVLLFTLLRSFRIELSVPKEVLMVLKVALTQRPSLRSEPTHPKLPLIISVEELVNDAVWKPFLVESD
ncbi:cytochrome P450 [Lentinula aciculospora]|uniref:Cytochrome P450 n=1 Tax=Lentinula aciculospora TaxID=153920 RepID=A0A9W9A7R1_9AGAR|nr:cytochrome P450 [Lentinula aciculospora]